MRDGGTDLDLPLPSSPESDLVFLRLLVSEMAYHAGAVLAGIRSNDPRGPTSQVTLQQLVDKADAYFELIRQRPS